MFLSFRKFADFFLSFFFLSVLLSPEIIKSENLNQINVVNNEINSNFLNSKKELQDYIIDSGDNLFIQFYPAKEFSDFYAVNEEGEVYLPRLRETNVRGLSTKEFTAPFVGIYATQEVYEKFTD